MNKRYQDKICLVTASASGIGQAIAERFAKEGATVLINSRKASNVNPVVDKINKEGGKAVAYVGNMAHEQDRKKVVKRIEEEYGRLDVLVLNHATSLHFGLTLDTPDKAIDAMFNTNFKSFVLLIRDLYPFIVKVKGNILMNASYTGYDPDKMLGIYGALKSGVLGLVKVFAKEFQFDGVRVNGVAPGIIKTKFAAPLYADKNSEETIK